MHVPKQNYTYIYIYEKHSLSICQGRGKAQRSPLSVINPRRSAVEFVSLGAMLTVFPIGREAWWNRAVASRLGLKKSAVNGWTNSMSQLWDHIPTNQISGDPWLVVSVGGLRI